MGTRGIVSIAFITGLTALTACSSGETSGGSPSTASDSVTSASSSVSTASASPSSATSSAVSSSAAPTTTSPTAASSTASASATSSTTIPSGTASPSATHRSPTPPATSERPPAPGEVSPSPVNGVTFGVPQPYTPGGDVMVEGLGAVRPTSFAASTHHTMVVKNIVWSSWGGQIARATGIAENGEKSSSMAGLPREKAYITAKLGTCHGRPAYTKVAWNFTSFEKNETNPAGWYNICDISAR